MSANSQDLLLKGARRFTTTLSGAIPDSVSTSLSLSTAVGLPTDTAIELTLDRVDLNSKLTLAKEEVVRGTVSGSNVINLIRGVEGTAQAHGVGSVVEIRLTSDQWNRMIDWGLTEHKQDGSHGDITADSITVGGNAVVTGDLPVKATGAEVNTGTNDDKFVTAKAVADSTITTPTKTQTFTNKRLTKRILSAASYTTDTGTSLNCDNLDMFIVTAQAGALKFNNPSGTPTIGQTLWISVTGTAARALTYDTQFAASTVALPTTTVTTARLDMGFVWSGTQWIIVACA